MIMPSKHVRPSHSLLGAAALLWDSLEAPQTISELWERSRLEHAIGSFDRFILSLDLLFFLRLVSLEDGLLERVAA